MDEPLSNLDAKLRVQTRAEIKKLHARLQTTTVYVTHDQTEAMTMGDRIVVMRDGLVQQVDSPMNLYDRPANQFVAGFIGSPAMNFIPARVAQNGSAYRISADGFNVEVPRDLTEPVRAMAGRDVVFGIRPEDIADRALLSEADPGWTIRAGVDVHEPLGSDVILYLTVGSHSIVARVDAHTQAKMGQQIEVVFNMRKMHLFDPQTQAALV
jgi:multiple sugar transport system ATP-binding protein